MNISPKEFLSASKPYHIKIKDILNLPVGKPVLLYCLDKQMFDVSCDVMYNKIDVSTKPSVFFRNGNFFEFTRTTGLFGKWKWRYDNIEKDREFDVKLSDGLWVQLYGGYIFPDLEKMIQIPIKYINKHYSMLPKKTYIGWRGNIMFASDMDKCPNIIMKNENGC